MLFNLALDSKLRSCDLISLKVRDIASSGLIQSRAMIEQQKTHREVQFEITAKTQQCLTQWVHEKQLAPSDFIFLSRRKLKNTLVIIIMQKLLSNGSLN